MIGILTFYWADDVGALLQCYALRSYLNPYQKAVVIPYFPKGLRTRYQLFRYYPDDSIPRRLIKMRRQLCTREFYSSLTAKYRMQRFRRRFLKVGLRRLGTPEEVLSYSGEIDTYVVGSDQVWNPEITEGFQNGYFCTFRKQRAIRCVAYAASIGGERLPPSCDVQMAELLSNFDAISVREALSAPYIGKLYGEIPVAVMDPVFLLERSKWEALLRRKKPPKERYIAVYDTEYSEEMAKCLKLLRERTGLPVLVLRPVRRHYEWQVNERYAAGCGIVEFLELLYHAEYVVTNSFHGTAMSILFQKAFTVFSHSERNARLADLLRALRLGERLARTAEEGERMIGQAIDWEKTGKALQKEAERSKAFIRSEILNL